MKDQIIWSADIISVMEIMNKNEKIHFLETISFSEKSKSSFQKCLRSWGMHRKACWKLLTSVEQLNSTATIFKGCCTSKCFIIGKCCTPISDNCKNNAFLSKRPCRNHWIFLGNGRSRDKSCPGRVWFNYSKRVF